MNKDKRNNIQILGTLNNADESGIIANANQIYDDVQQKDQETINSDLQTNINAEAIRAQSAESNLQELYRGLTQSNIEVVSTLPKTGETYKIYRLIGVNSYADYMYNSSDLTTPIKMAEYDNAIDNEPTAGSNNLVKSGGVYSSTPTVANSTAKSDLDISDENGQVLARFADGHIQVKNFSSADVLESIQAILSNIGFDNVPEFSDEEDYTIGDIVRYGKYIYVFTSAHTAGEWNDIEVERTVINTEHPVEVNENSDSDLDVADENGNVLARFKDGHIKTKNFDSEKVATKEEVSSIEPPIEVNDNADSDLDVADENGNVLARFKDGHIKTKNFDSEKVATKEEVSSIEPPIEVNDNADSDLDVADENGNVLARFKDGHIKTKNFDSEKVATKEEVFSKIKFVAFGDSITDSDTSIGSCLGDVICNFLGTKRINNWARGNATMSDYSSITDGIRNNITPINLAYPPNSTVPYNVISNQVLRMLQWTTPLNKQIEWNHNIDGRFSINTSYGTGLGHTSDIPDIIYIAGGTNDTKDSYRCVDDTETVFGQTYSNLTRITIASALRWIIETLQSVYPLAHIFVASPLQTSRGWNWDSGGYTGLRTQSTWQVRQIIEKVTRFESVHFIDSYSESGFNNLIATKINDGIHPKGIWRDAIAKYVSNEIKNKYYNR